MYLLYIATIAFVRHCIDKKIEFIAKSGSFGLRRGRVRAQSLDILVGQCTVLRILIEEQTEGSE